MARVITVDFEGVESGGGSAHVPEGDYGLKVKTIKTKKGEDSGKPYLDIQFKIVKGKKGIGKLIRHSCSLQKSALWNLRNLLEACGKTVPAKAVKIDLDKMLGATCAATLIDDEYEGRKKSIVSAFFPLEDLGKTSETGDDLEETEGEAEEESTEEEETSSKKKKKEKKKKEEAEEETETEEETEEDELFN
jgi:hypothetical protein